MTFSVRTPGRSMRLFPRLLDFMGANGNLGSTPERLAQARHDMVETQIRKRHVTNSRVLQCLERVPRHEFVPAEFRDRAYEDAPLPIGGGQTISQPYIVAAMTAALNLQGDERVLEIGTGFGYQAAVLASLSREVFTVEFRAELATEAAERLSRLGHSNVHVHCGDGTLGLPEFAPYDAILVAAAAPSVPAPLLAQLADGGRMVVPVGGVENQDLQLIQRSCDTFRTTTLEPCRFVPLLGAHGWKDSPRQ
jgi:protein-L-isoaspartate(D-aspartate) O-methyltransferase